MIRRFYREVKVAQAGHGWQVLLDARGIKTVGGSPQIVPTLPLAEALAAEWARQGDRIDPTDLPLRDMADYAIDVVAADRAALARQLAAYADSDTLCYRADPEEPLHARQLTVWEPVLSGFESRFGVRMVRISGIIHRPQDEAVVAMLEHSLATESAFALVGLEVMTKLAASLVTSLMALEAETEERTLALWQAACLEEEWQAELWGRDEEAEQRRVRRTTEFLRGWQFARLAQTG